MKKKLTIIISIVLLVSIVIIDKFEPFDLLKDEDLNQGNISDADLSFSVLSDIHNNDERLTKAIKDLHKINCQMDAMILNGDTVDQGIDEQYENIAKVLEKNSSKLPNKIIKNMGNHEYYNYDADTCTEQDLKDRQNKYLNFSGYDKIYHDEWVKGYHFISLGSDSNKVSELNNTGACISDEQINWLKSKIEEKYEKGKPIFIFLHQPINGKFFELNVYSTNRSKEIEKILCQYPEVVLFSSHNHIKPDEENDKSFKPVTVSTGSVNANFVRDKSNKYGYSSDDSFSNGIYVEVKGNKVIVKARDFLNKDWIYTREI